jgi:biotin carboxyl carrier protein
MPDWEEVSAFIEAIRPAQCSLVTVTIGDWSLHVRRTPCPVPGFSVDYTMDVGHNQRGGATWREVIAPHVATVWLEKAADIGGLVTASTQLCRLEVLHSSKMLHARVPGILRRICVADGDLVEAGRVLFLIEPAVADERS